MTIPIPLGAWEQATIVVLFAVIFLALIFFLVCSAIQIITIVKQIVSETSEGFQKFLVERDGQWQSYLKEFREDDRQAQTIREEAFSARNGQVVEALNNLTARIQAMAAFDAEHHSMMTEAIQDMRKTVASKARPANK
jgi:5-bromo-4-chloroindolyl phosphate hydrolysis protein